MNHVFRTLPLLALLLAFASAQIDPAAAATLERAREAHGGDALEAMTSYRDEGTMIALDPAGVPAQELRVRTWIDLDGERVRLEMLQDGAPTMIQQATPEGGFAATPQGEFPLAPEVAAELLEALDFGVYGLRRGLDGVERATHLGERTLAGATGEAVEVVRGGVAVTFLFAEDGTLLAESYVTPNVGETINVYLEHADVDGVRLPVAYESWAMGMRLLEMRLDAIETNPPLADVFGANELGAAPVPTPEARAWLRDAAVPLEGVDAGRGLADLAPFGAIVGDARIVGLGEQTHGTSEFFRLKHRLLEYLVVEEGFSVFAIEANLPEAERLNAYVLGGAGDAAELIGGMHFWTWDTEEVLALVEWMRAYNASGPHRVRFAGFDMQFAGAALDEARSFLAAADPELLARFEPALRAVAEASAATGMVDLPGAEAGALVAELEPLVAEAEANRAAYEAALGAEATDLGLRNVRLVLQATGVNAGGVVWRDAAMAENVAWLAERYAGERIVLWAHNGHVARAEGWMGGHLAERFGDAYLPVGFSFGEGAYRARGPEGGLGVHAAGPGPEGSVDAFLASLDADAFLLDLRGAAGSPAAPWLAEPRLFRSIGAVAMGDLAAFAPTDLDANFDVVAFVAESTPAQGLP